MAFTTDFAPKSFGRGSQQAVGEQRFSQNTSSQEGCGDVSGAWGSGFRINHTAGSLTECCKDLQLGFKVGVQAGNSSSFPKQRAPYEL